MSYPLVINTFPYIWTYSVDHCLAHLAKRGYPRVEIMLTEPHCWPSTLSPEIRREVADRVRAKEIDISSINLGGFDNNFASPAREAQDAAVGIMSAVIDLAGEWGARGIVMSPGLGRPLLPPPLAMLEGNFRKAIEKVLPRAEGAGVDLLLENIPYSFLPKAEGLAAMIESIKHSRLGVCYDVPNAVFAREDPDQGFRRLREHLRLVHFSDTGLDVWRHDRIGKGIVDFKRALEMMKEITYSGPLALEIIDPDGDGAIDESVAAVSKLGVELPRAL
jgi:sugar phosphate isomerase/epimerase